MTFLRRIINLFLRAKVDREIDAELRAHIEMRTADNIAQGMSPAQARRDALLRFGNPAATKDRVTAADLALGLDGFFRDLRYALRQLGKFPIFAATTILILALGIGATTAIFTVMNAVLLRSMPVPDPQQVVYLHVPGGQPDGASNTGDSETSFSEPVFQALRRRPRAFSDVIAFAPLSTDERVAVRIGSSPPEQNAGEMVSGNFFSGLGITMARGRGFSLDDEVQHAPVAVLSYSFWTRRFSRSPDALGQTMFIKGIPFTIIGVAGQGFPGVTPSQFTDFWIPLQRGPQLNPWGSPANRTLYSSPTWWCLRLIARLAPSVTPRQAAAEALPAFQAAAYAGLGTPDPENSESHVGCRPRQRHSGPRRQ